MRNRWAPIAEAVKRWSAKITSPREEAQAFYEMIAIAPLLVVAVFPGIIVAGLAAR